jgi:hypothetical protein
MSPIEASGLGMDGTAERKRVPKPPTSRMALISFTYLLEGLSKGVNSWVKHRGIRWAAYGAEISR